MRWIALKKQKLDLPHSVRYVGPDAIDGQYAQPEPVEPLLIAFLCSYSPMFRFTGSSYGFSMPARQSTVRAHWSMVSHSPSYHMLYRSPIKVLSTIPVGKHMTLLLHAPLNCISGCCLPASIGWNFRRMICALVHLITHHD